MGDLRIRGCISTIALKSYCKNHNESKLWFNQGRVAEVMALRSVIAAPHLGRRIYDAPYSNIIHARLIGKQICLILSFKDFLGLSHRAQQNAMPYQFPKTPNASAIISSCTSFSIPLTLFCKLPFSVTRSTSSAPTTNAFNVLILLHLRLWHATYARRVKIRLRRLHTS